VRYRATIKPGPGKDGKTVNAQVDYDPPGWDLGAPWDPQALQPLQVRFALADLKRSLSSREPLGPDDDRFRASSSREPLGLTADPRWNWHEYSHVLLAASTGELEFRFAHSAGDALAAILWDPPSMLALEPSELAPDQRKLVPDQPLRMATFPWVYLNRRHDRSVYAGWSWCGTYHRPLRFLSGGGTRRHKGYQSEQILSTSLFRTYRALGGDTALSDGSERADQMVRWSAADYTAYLIVRAIALLGPASAVPAETADQFVSALTDADVGTGNWQIPPRDSSWPSRERIGGCVYKVVRWAFEAQGLYAATDLLKIVDAPGKPPDIDVFIEDWRPDSDGAFPRGGYMPVSLDWNVAPKHPRWHASDDALRIENDQATVRVCNRGRLDAPGVVVQVWYIAWPVTSPEPPYLPPRWDPATWTKLGTSASGTVPAGGELAFAPFSGVPTTTGRYLILAEASCPDDRANTDPVAALPSAGPTPIVDLVAGDNNLGLRFYVVP
jgi:hypothetical protein